MKVYLSGADAVSDLHQKGYTNDFQFYGNDLLWVQEKIFIRVGEVAIVECHKIISLQKKIDQLLIFGIYAPGHNIKGILVNHCKNYTYATPPVIRKKLNEMYVLAGINTFV